MDLVRLQPNTFTSKVTTQSIDAVWAAASDPLLLPPLSSELQEVRLLGDGPAELGSRFHGDQLRDERRWTTTSTVTAFEPFTIFEWTVGDLACPVSTWAFLLDEHPLGTTLTQRVVLRGGPSPLTEFVSRHPESAEEVVLERLATLRERMAVTVNGLLEFAAMSGDDGPLG